jgi:hypothetical protein
MVTLPKTLLLTTDVAQKKFTSASLTCPSSETCSLFTSFGLALAPLKAGVVAFAFFPAGISSPSSVSSVAVNLSGDFLALFLEAGVAVALGVVEPFLVGVLGVVAPLLVCKPEERAPYLTCRNEILLACPSKFHNEGERQDALIPELVLRDAHQLPGGSGGLETCDSGELVVVNL